MVFLVFLLCFIFVLIPFVPAVFEIFKKTDLNPLQISNQILKDPRRVPDYVFWYLAHLLGASDLEELKNKVTVNKAVLLNGNLLAVPQGKLHHVDSKIARVISSGELYLAEKLTYIQKILSLDSIHAGNGIRLNEVHAQAQLVLGDRAKLIWWATAEHVVLGDKVELPGKIQASKSITFKGSGQFHLLQALEVKTELPVILSEVRIHPVIDRIHGRVHAKKIMKGNNTIPEQSQVIESMVVKGDLRIGKNSQIFGDLKVYGNLVIENGVTIEGNIVCMKSIQMMGENLILGTVLAENEIKIGNHVQVGAPDQRITVSANYLKIQGPFHVYGLLRAWKQGEIISLFH